MRRRSAGRGSARGFWDTCAADVLAVGIRHGKEQVLGHPKCANLIGKWTWAALVKPRGCLSFVGSDSARYAAVAMFPAIVDTMLMLDRMAEAEVAIGAIN